MSDLIPPLIPGFDLDACRLPQDFGATLGVKKLLTRVPVRKPNNTEFFRSSTAPEHHFLAMVLELKQESETYLVTQAVQGVLPELLRPVELRIAVDRYGNVFIIPVPLPGSDGRRNPWHESLAAAVLEAETNWVRMTSNKHIGAYELHVALNDLGRPQWPERSMPELLQIAFRGRLIDSTEHPVVQQLLGQL